MTASRWISLPVPTAGRGWSQAARFVANPGHQTAVDTGAARREEARLEPHRGAVISDKRTFRIVGADELSLDQFARVHDLLVSLAEPGSGDEHLLPAFGFKFVLRTTELPVTDCDLIAT